MSRHRPNPPHVPDAREGVAREFLGDLRVAAHGVEEIEQFAVVPVVQFRKRDFVPAADAAHKGRVGRILHWLLSHEQ